MKHKEREEKSTSVSYRMTAGSLILGWPKFVQIFLSEVTGTPNELFGLPNTCAAIVPRGGGGSDKT